MHESCVWDIQTILCEIYIEKCDKFKVHTWTWYVLRYEKSKYENPVNDCKNLNSKLFDLILF